MTQPTKAAYRAADIAIEHAGPGFDALRDELAAEIDEVTGLPELVAACQTQGIAIQYLEDHASVLLHPNGFVRTAQRKATAAISKAQREGV